MFEYCKICPNNENNICILELEEEPIDNITYCIYPKLCDKEQYNQYIEREEDKK